MSLKDWKLSDEAKADIDEIENNMRSAHANGDKLLLGNTPTLPEPGPVLQPDSVSGALMMLADAAGSPTGAKATIGWIKDLKAHDEALRKQLETAEATVGRLREALERIEIAAQFFSQDGVSAEQVKYAHESTERLARAALEGREDG